MNMSFEWSPYLSSPWIWLAGLAAVIIAFVAWQRRAGDFYWRAALFGVIVFLMLNPIMLREAREGLPDKVVIVVDDSASQKIAGRDAVAERALEYIREKLGGEGAPETIIVHAAGNDSTQMFSALRDNLMSIPLQQVAGTIFITDGQVHDVPVELGILEKLAPLHVVLTGMKDEFDRKVTVVSAPKYGLLNDEVRIRVRVDEFGRKEGAPVMLQVSQDGQKQDETPMTPGEEREFSFKLPHPGQNVFEFSVPPAEGELTDINNTAPVIINGVRDRLKVLLVSGTPHMGERAWRNLLKSDPGIDLVHFTILRSPLARDPTPTRELSLIVFPVDKLFAEKISDFDLIIFDRYQQYNLLMPFYFENIRNYVRNGGAFLMAMGSDKADDSIFATAMADILPVEPRSQNVMRDAFVPALTQDGKKHPITADLASQKAWGKWFTQVDVTKLRGDTLMTGQEDRPLLVIDKVEKGRVAALSSDNIWLWSKGGTSAGPYSELLRNVAHWLMKEPELEEDYIKADADGNLITVAKRDIGTDAKTVTMTRPSGAQEEINLQTREKGWILAKIDAEENGIYSFAHGDKKAFVVVGTAQNQEFSDVHTTADILKPAVDKTNGGIIWFQDAPAFELRRVNADARQMAGDDWIGLKANKAYNVNHVESHNLVNNWLFLLIILSALVWTWRRESGK